ncbi:MAG: WXG100 family type VII secretion target [Lachnospiraceae bacterium]|nr:WXG100 family type VII secretion target [Candidatus Colinaster scatohippi]
MGIINIDFADVANKASQIKEKADTISSISRSDMASDVETLVTTWKGDSSSDYYKKYYKLNNTVNSKAKDISKIAKELEKKAKKLKDTEIFGVSLFGS